MLLLAESVRAVLVPFITALAVLLGAMLVVLIAQRAIREAIVSRHARRKQHCRPYVDAWMAPDTDAAALDRLAADCGGPYRRAVASLLLPALRSVTGDLVERSRDALTRIGLRDEWVTGLEDRRWWRRAEAAQALGLIGESQAAPTLVRLLDDEHEEARAAALEALGRLAILDTLPALVALLEHDGHQRARVVSALRAFGPAAATELARRAGAHPMDRGMVAEVLGQIGGALGLERLADWADDADPAVRAACQRAMGDIGLDERAYYFALRALGDEDVTVRAMAARALGRSGRTDATQYLAAHLGDDWQAAAHSAAALKQLGPEGIARLEASVSQNGPGAELARQMLWELRV